MSEDTSVQKLDAALENYQQPKQPDVTEGMAAMRQELDEIKVEKQQKADKDEYEHEMSDLIAHVREDADITHSDTVVRGTINALAEQNPTFVEAYKNRKENPDAYKEVKDWAKAKVSEELVMDTSKQKVVQASFASAGHSDNEPPKDRNDKTDAEILKMPRGEFEAWKAHNR